MNKNKLYILTSVFTLLFIISLSLSSASVCTPSMNIVSQDPEPAIVDGYVKILFEISNLTGCDGFAVKLSPEYPFSLDDNVSAIQTIKSSPYVSQDYKNSWTIPYKIRVDSNAFDGEYNLNLRYHSGTSKDFTNYLEKSFSISVEDSRTQFDAVIQESSGNDVSIALANVGKFTANSVVVRIPLQESFTATGTDGQMVGNLESGDYTIVGFTLNKKVAMQGRNSTRNQADNPSSNSLKFDIYYTDNIGERRIVNMQLPLNMGNSSFSAAGGFSRNTQTKTSYTSYYILAALVLIVAAFFFAKKKGLFKKSRRTDSKDDTPDWIKNAKDKEKNK